jgi:hypothetical protein
MMGTANAFAAVGQLVVVLSLAYFLMISGDTFRFALVKRLRRQPARKDGTAHHGADETANSALLGDTARHQRLLGVVGAILPDWDWRAHSSGAVAALCCT